MRGVKMSNNYSPLRYPGGKAKLYPYVKDIIEINNLSGGTYIEPFAGGCGLALKLLLNNDVSQIVINDLDPSIFAIWFSILNDTDEMNKFVMETPITVDEWQRQKAVYNNPTDFSQLDLAKATLFLNRTNVSGVITGGIIGGIKQNGKYKIDARFNRAALVKKIERIAQASNRIALYNLDVLDFLKKPISKTCDNIFINFDPPYVQKGKELYRNSFTKSDHQNLRDEISRCTARWIVTYDVCDLIAELYQTFRGSEIDVNYSANGIKKAKEFVFFSDDLTLPHTIEITLPPSHL